MHSSGQQGKLGSKAQQSKKLTGPTFLMYINEQAHLAFLDCLLARHETCWPQAIALPAKSSTAPMFQLLQLGGQEQCLYLVVVPNLFQLISPFHDMGLGVLELL